MSRFNPADSGYIEVKDRVVEFYGKYPEGSIQAEIAHLTDSLVVVKAYAYRDREDPLPGIGHSQMKIPGPTNFTKDSEIENAETSAIGRAIAALGFSVHKSYASANEVANKQEDKPAESKPAPAAVPLASKEQHDELKNLAAGFGLSKSEMTVLRKAHTDKARSSEFTVTDYTAMRIAIQETGAIKVAAGTGSEVVA